MMNDSFRKDIEVKKGPPENAENLSKLVLNTEGNGYEGY
jgi:hypothetical protein